MFDVVLFQPEIPPNTGNVIRLSANTAARLHLVEPLGFRMEDRALKRAGLDYHEYATVRVHRDWPAAQQVLAGRRMFAFSTRAGLLYGQIAFQPDDVFVFGSETRGLPAHVLEGFMPARRLRLPLVAGNRSLNLSNAVAVVVYEAWRQNGFVGGV